MKKETNQALPAEEEKGQKRQLKIAVIAFAVFEALVFAIFIYKVLQTR